jgi:AraC-like DNA-binding protein
MTVRCNSHRRQTTSTKPRWAGLKILVQRRPPAEILLVRMSTGRGAPGAPAVEPEIAVVPGVTVSVHECSKPPGGWSSLDVHDTYGLVFVRRGGFRRRAQGRDHYVGPATAFFEVLGAEDEVLHPHDGGDTTSIFTLTEAAVGQFVGNCDVPGQPILTPGPIDLAHRRLIAAVCEGIDHFEAGERLAELVGSVIEHAAPGRLTTSRPATERAHDRLVDAVREAIVADPAGSDLATLAALTGHSPFHLSRVFRRRSGVTLTHFRNRIRVAAALVVLEQGQADLALVAAQLGFSDQAHMTRVIRDHLGHPPASVRRLLQATPS